MLRYVFRKLNGHNADATYTSIENFFESYDKTEFDAFLTENAEHVFEMPSFRLSNDGSSVMMQLIFVDEQALDTVIQVESEKGFDWSGHFNWQPITENDFLAG